MISCTDEEWRVEDGRMDEGERVRGRERSVECHLLSGQLRRFRNDRPSCDVPRSQVGFLHHSFYSKGLRAYSNIRKDTDTRRNPKTLHKCR